MIDLHVHSTFSDGTFTPAALVERAVQIGLTAMALTDHDTTRGNEMMLEAAKGRGLCGVPGVEISVDIHPGTLHMLGYFFRSGDRALEEALAQIREGRQERNADILRKLNALNLSVTMPEVEAYAGEDVVGRLHFAQALVAKGYVSSTQEAFDRYLARGKPAYCERLRLSVQDAIARIRGAGGVTVLAHPSTLQLGPAEMKTRIAEFVHAGLQGIEVYYSEHNRDQEREYAALASKFHLVATGGSDFHGATNPAIELGRGFGSLNVPDRIVDELRERANH